LSAIHPKIIYTLLAQFSGQAILTYLTAHGGHIDHILERFYQDDLSTLPAILNMPENEFALGIDWLTKRGLVQRQKTADGLPVADE
jgi:hypothetical protein